MTSSASSTSVGACSSHRAGFVVNVVVVVEFVVVVVVELYYHCNGLCVVFIVLNGTDKVYVVR